MRCTMKLRKKRYKAECKKCRTIKKMEVVGTSDDDRYVWLRCNSCHMVFLFPATWFDKQSIVQPPVEVQLFNPSNINAHKVVEYSLNKTFILGQRIYHKRFNDVGEVISKRKLENGSKIVVAFKRCGEKTLVEGLSPA